MKLCASRDREKERKRKIKGTRRERKKNLGFPRGGCCSAAATTVVFQTLEFPPGCRSHHAHQFALRYKLGDRLYPDYGVTRYRAVFECGGTHDDADPPIVEHGYRGLLFTVDRACAWVKFVRDAYVCTKHTARTGRGRVIIIRKASHSFWITQCVASTIVISADWQRKDTEKRA